MEEGKETSENSNNNKENETMMLVDQMPMPGSKQSPIERPFGTGDKGLLFMMSANPVTDPTSGSGTCHRDWAEALTEMGYDVVIIQSENKFNTFFNRVPFRMWDVPFNGRILNPENKGKGSEYERYANGIPFNYLAFEAATRSSQRFIDVEANTLEAYYLSFAWAYRSAALVFGKPDVAWNGHVWVQNDITTSVPTVFTVHGTGAAKSAKGGREKRYIPLVKRSNGRAFAAAAISPQEYESVTAFGFDPIRARILPNGFNPRVFYPDRNASKASVLTEHASRLSGVSSEDNWVTFAGRAANFKGVDNLIKAFARTLEEKPNSRLLIMGSGDFSKIEVKKDLYVDCIALAKELGVSDRVHFLGPVPQKMMADLINVSEAYALPSRKEPFGLTFPEGMASGQAPIVTRDGGFVDIVAQCAGIPKGDVKPGVYPFCTVVPAESRKSKASSALAVEMLANRTDVDANVIGLAIRMLQGEIKNGELDLSVPVNKQAVELMKIARWEAASERTVAGLAEAMVNDISLKASDRAARGKAAAEIAFEHYSVGKMVQLRMEPLIREAIRSGQYADGWTDAENWETLSPKRSERLLKIQKRPELGYAYRELVDLLDGQDQDKIGGAWRKFDWEATRFFGTEKFLHPLDLEALPDLAVRPNGLMSELARGAGVHVDKMVATMNRVAQIPWQHLTLPSVMHPQAFPKTAQLASSQFVGDSGPSAHGTLNAGSAVSTTGMDSAHVFMNQAILPAHLSMMQAGMASRFFVGRF
ncbi:MAG: glycosyltransferase family 4 protein [Deltaproteobacteria bacterium]|nr:glycosyltransferase family 4 protein [Deltaproteobacteria bacterium]